MKFIELCRYTLKGSFEDTGKYYYPISIRNAQELIDEVKTK